MTKGKVYLIGAGPGDPGLLTLRGRENLEKADCVIYDRLAAPELLKMIPDTAERIYVGKENRHHTMRQEEINALLVEKASRYSHIVRLKGGDPYVFGRGGEEGLFLREHGVDFEEVPGISSAIAGLAYAGIPITHRGLATGFHVITAHNRRDELTDIDFDKLTDPSETCVFLMGLGKVREIAEGLMAAGRAPETPAAVISCACTPRQRVAEGCLADIADRTLAEGLQSPALIVVGEVVRLRGQLDTRADQPLSGRRYLVTKIGAAPSPLSRMLREQGAVVEEVQTGEICYLPDNPIACPETQNVCHENQNACQDLLSPIPSRFPDNSWILFTSRHGVEGFFRERRRRKMDMRSLAGARFGVVGAKTALVLEAWGIYPDLVAEKETGAGLAAEVSRWIADYEESQAKVSDCVPIFYYRAEGAAELSELASYPGYCSIPIYQNKATPLGAVEWENYQAVFFTCASSVKRLLQGERLTGLLAQNLGERQNLREQQNLRGEDAGRTGPDRRIRIYAMGPTTGRALDKLGITDWVAPQQPSYEAMAEAEVAKWQNTPM